MASNRRQVQQAHERFNIELFLQYFNQSYRSNFAIFEEPNPPDAIILSGRTKRWVEVTSAFWKQEFAIDQYSYATNGEIHKPMKYGFGVGADEEFASNFVSVLKKKLEKETYEKLRDSMGRGYLIVSIQYPLFTQHTLKYIHNAWSTLALNDKNCFRSIYLTYRVFKGYKVSFWRSYKNKASRF